MAALDVFDTIINCVLIEIIAVIGLCGNAITLLVLFRNGVTASNNRLLLSLSCCDLYYSASLIVTKLVCVVEHFDTLNDRKYQPYTSILPYIWGSGRVAMNLSLFHIVCIALERVMAVFYPFKVSRWVTPRKTIVILGIMYTYLTVLLFPWIFSYFKYEWVYDTHNRTVLVQKLAQFYQDNRAVLDFYNEVILNILLGPLCILVVLVSSCAIAYKLYILTKVRSLMTSGRSENTIDIKVSRMLLTVCAIYIITGIPATFVHMYSYINPEMEMGSTMYSFLHDNEECFRALNSAANFFVYVLMSAKFNSRVKSVVFFC